MQVLAELYVNAVGKLMLPENQIAKVLGSLGGDPVLPITEAVLGSALAIRKRYRISCWDGAIITAAAKLGCLKVYSEDLNHGQTYAGAAVVNPFRGRTLLLCLFTPLRENLLAGSTAEEVSRKGPKPPIKRRNFDR